MKRIKTVLTSFMMMFALAAPMAVPALASAQITSDTIKNEICKGATASTSGTCATGAGQNDLLSIVRRVITLLSLIIGFVAIFMIIWGGFKYLTSGGDSKNVDAAKSTILYAIIGLVVVLFAQAIVFFVVDNVTKQ